MGRARFSFFNVHIIIVVDIAIVDLLFVDDIAVFIADIS